MVISFKYWKTVIRFPLGAADVGALFIIIIPMQNKQAEISWLTS